MYNRTRTIKRWKNNPNMTLDDMYEKALEKGYTNNNVETQEDLRYFVCSMVNKDFAVARLLQSIEENTAAYYFKFDVTGWSNTTATPIYDKEDLSKALL